MQLWATSDSGSISFVSYFSFVSKRLEPQRSIATWSHSRIMDQKGLFFSYWRLLATRHLWPNWDTVSGK